MTETTQPTHGLAPAADRPVQPADSLLNLIAILLAPMFLGACGGDIAFARMVATETVNAYRTRNQADLIAVAQIIAFGLAAIGSISLSMADDISLPMTLRLRGNANALSRSAERNRRAFMESRSEPADIQPPVNAGDEAAVIASVADSQKRVADAQTRVADPQPRVQHTRPAPIPAPAATPAIPAADMTDREKNALWAAAMTEVAQEYTDSLPRLPPPERRAASLRAAALSSTASHLLTGLPVPDIRPPRP